VGLLGRIKKAIAPSLEERIRQEAKQKVDEMRRLAKEGASKDEIEALVKEMLRSTEFYQILGEIRQSAPDAIGIELRRSEFGSREGYEEVYKRSWERFTRAQEDADKFFSNTIMRSWAVARTVKDQSPSMKWEQIDALLGNNERWNNKFRDSEWWYVPWAFAIADEVQERHGAGSCTSERFESMWDEMTSDEVVNKFLSTLSDEQVAYYRCTD